MSYAVEAEGLVKRFGKHEALAGLDLAIPEGRVYGVLGPNGAGKTTALRVLATLLRPDKGSARVFGHDVVSEADKVRHRVSLTGQFSSVDGDLTGAENLTLIGRLLGFTGGALKAKTDDMLGAFGLVEAADRQVKKYSGGMRRRLDIAAGILAVPDLLFLDEPTVGLDPRSRADVWAIIRTVVDQGTTVLLTTQYLEEADRLADRIAVIDHGRVISEGTPSDLKRSVGAGSLTLRLRDRSDIGHALETVRHVLGTGDYAENEPDAVIASLDAQAERTTEQISRLMKELSVRDISIADFTMGQPTLDEVFLALTDHPATQQQTKELIS